MNEESEKEVDRTDLEQAREYLEVLHGDLVRSSYQSEEEMEGLVNQAEGLKTALNIIKQVESGEWDGELATKALAQIGDGDGEVDAERLRDLSKHVRNDNLASEHAVVNRVVVDKEPRSRWQLVKDLFGVGDRA